MSDYFGYPPEECTAELIDVDGGELVVIKSPDGRPLVYMPLDQWEAIRALNERARLM